jgi:3-hydroxyisobutyrate dehydrogenase-like beta-hydroxyacid dehydrogenase
MRGDIESAVRLGFIGFGEASQAFLSGLQTETTVSASAFDIKSRDPKAAEKLASAYHATRTKGATSPQEALNGTQGIFCLVTADQAVHAASEAAPFVSQGTFWFDGNSCSPGAKKRSASVIAAAGGRYIDMAIMAPVYPKRHKTPVLLSGPHAEQAADFLKTLGMNITVVGPEIGTASSIKMIRSVMVKGLEALTAECFLAARKAGVDDNVINSLIASDPAIDWRLRGAYNLERMLVHGARRAAEMREVSMTLQELGFDGAMASATADWQAHLAALTLDAGADDLTDRLDRILAALS